MNHLFRKPALLFDLDGTLIDSFSQITTACNKSRTSHGFSAASVDFLMKVIGLPAEQLFSDLDVSQSLIDNLVNGFRKELAELIQVENPSFPYAQQFIQLARNAGHEIGVATSKPKDLAVKVIANSVFSAQIDHIAGTGTLRAKPEPDVIYSCLNKFGTDSAIMFGDRPEDILAAEKAGIKAIGLAQGTFTVQDLHSAGAVQSYISFKTLYLDVLAHEGDISGYIKELCG